jgi:hypothetical protein
MILGFPAGALMSCIEGRKEGRKGGRRDETMTGVWWIGVYRGTGWWVEARAIVSHTESEPASRVRCETKL